MTKLVSDPTLVGCSLSCCFKTASFPDTHLAGQGSGNEASFDINTELFSPIPLLQTFPNLPSPIAVVPVDIWLKEAVKELVLIEVEWQSTDTAAQ